MKKSPSLFHEDAARAKGARVIAGVDEAGRGPWAGPVVACAFVFHCAPPPGLNDSKKLTAKRRAALAELLPELGVFGIGEASVEEIDALNIRQATHLAMRRAIANLPEAPNYLLIDGNDRPKALPCPSETLIGGDGRSASIAAASVMAKTRRDLGMVALSQQFPGYGWEHNMGYGTAQHVSALETLGVTQHHRHSFKPIARYSSHNLALLRRSGRFDGKGSEKPS